MSQVETQEEAPVEAPKFSLTPMQEEAVQAMFNHLESEHRYFVLQGYAGTGKTTLIQEFILRLLKSDQYGHDQICLTAPTNKATKVLKTKAKEAGIGSIKTATVHSLLRIIPQIEEKKDENGDTIQVETFKPLADNQFERPSDEDRAPAVGELAVWVIDEASMVSEELLNYIDDAMNQCLEAPKVVFIGDPAQLPPIGEKISRVFDNDNKFVLTEVIRQAADNPIIANLTLLRNSLETSYVKLSDAINGDLNGETGMKTFFSQSQFETAVAEEFKHFHENPNHVRVVAWRNVTVRQYNDFIRKVLYGSDAGQDFLTGEILMMREPFILKSPTGMTTVVADNSEEFTVVSKTVINDGISFQDGDIRHDFQFKAYDVLAKSLATDKMANLKVLQPVDTENHKAALQKLVTMAKGNKYFWKYYFQLKNMFAKAEYAYSITAHKSQGSTFNKVFVIRKDINLNKNVVEKNQCLYVAISRCREFAGLL